MSEPDNEQTDYEFDNAYQEFVSQDNESNDEARDAPDNETAAVEEAPAQTQPEEAEEPGNAEDKNPEAPASLEDQLEALKQQNQDLEHYKRSNEGRVSALQRKVDELSQPPEAAPEPAPDTRNEEWEQFESEDEYTAKHIESRVNQSARQVKNEMLNELENRLQPIQESEHQRYVDSQVAILNQQAPDWDDTVHSIEFQNWVSAQPAKVQELTTSFDASDYLYLLNGFNATKQPGKDVASIKQQRQKKLESNEAVPRRNAGRVTGAPDDFDGAYDYYVKQDALKQERGY